MLYIRDRTLSSAKLPMLKFERVLLIFNPLFFLQMILLRDFQSCGARPAAALGSDASGEWQV